MSCCPRGSQLISFYSPIQMSEGNCDILLFGTMGHIGEDVQHCLERHRLKVARVEFPQNVFRDESGYRRSLAKSLEHYSPAVVMPVGDSYAMSRAKDLLPAGCCATVDSPEKTALLNGKVSFSALCGKLGIRQPRLYSTVSETGLPSAAQAGKMDKDEIVQVVFKRDISFGGHGVHRPLSIEALNQLIAHQRPGEPYLIEEYVSGCDYSVDAVRMGSFFSSGAYKTLSSNGNGPSLQRQSVDFPQLSEIARRIMEKVGYNGLCGFDFRIDSNGTPYILECNPRFTAGVRTQFEAGFDIPRLLYTLFKSGSGSVSTDD